MHQTDQELNEYLDNESADRAALESHLSACDECAARLSTLQNLFAELDSLPELALTKSLAAPFIPRPSLVPQLPRWLTLTAFLQAAAALVALTVAIPFVSTMLPQIETPSFTNLFIQLQTQWSALLDMLSTFHFPELEPLSLPIMEMSTLLIALAVVSIFWIFGNGLLLRNQNRN
ncbi:MAG: hypothetical protein HYZ21_01055 [Chloroflexi bacterium]|nr:hypothetical protein [Chloroflexota bacterium]